MKYKVDLHIHTHYSDGGFSPSEIVSRRKREGYSIIAITDHDNYDGVAEGIREGEKLGIRVIPGIEISSELYDGTELHILGYAFDTGSEEMIAKTEELRDARRERNMKLIELFRRQGYDITYEELIKGKKGGYIGKPDFGRAFVRKGYIGKAEEIFTPGRYLCSPEAEKIKKVKMRSEDAVGLIRRAGGIPVLAHPIQIKNRGMKGSSGFYASVEEIIKGLIPYGLEGVECWHRDHTEENSYMFSLIADRYGLQKTIGSDFHGDDIKGDWIYPEKTNISIDKILDKM